MGLGECTHTVAEFNQVKIRLIRYLHEQQGYDVLAFESPILNCDRANRMLAVQEPGVVLKDAIYGVWSTADVAQLFAYVHATQSTTHPLILAGFDVQAYADNNDMSWRPTLFQSAIQGVDAAYAQEVHDLDAEYLEDIYQSNLLRSKADEFKSRYQALVTWIDAHAAQLNAANPDKPLLSIMLRQAAASVGPNIDAILLSGTSGYEARDAGMAANLEALVGSAYPGKKILVWAHNAHLMHDARAQSYGFVGMGNLIKAKYGSEVYILGLTFGSGTFLSSNGAGGWRSVMDATPASKSLEALLQTTGFAYQFMDLTQAPPNGSDDWREQSFPTRDDAWFDSIIPISQYEGILMVDKVHPAIWQ